MKCVVVTGRSGTGQPTLLAELATRGYRSVDTCCGDCLETVDDEQWWVAARIDALLSSVGAVADVVLAAVR